MHLKSNLIVLLVLCLLGPIDLAAQRKRRKRDVIPIMTNPTSAIDRNKGYVQRVQLNANSLVNSIPFKSIGPTIMSGRVTDLAVNTADPSHFYVAYASGGLWKTESNGLDFTPLFDDQAVMTIGDIAVKWKSTGDIIWVGTGENNSSRSSYAGNGIYKSVNSGKTWVHLGLEETHHIGRIILSPNDEQTVWVGALGHLYSDNPERGVFKTTDGGETWTKTLFVDDKTGIIDLAIDPSNPNILYAAAWERRRYAWNFKASGTGSGIYKSTDAGESWQKLTVPGAGFPTTAGVGRIGLDVAATNPSIVYAILDNQDRRAPEETEENNLLTKDKLRAMSPEMFTALENEVVNAFLDEYNFPENYNATDIKKQIASGEVKPLALVAYLEDANSLLFDTPVKGAEMYRSTDGEKPGKNT